MNEVKSKEQFEYLFKAKRVILFLNFKWSGYTSMTRPFIYNWIEGSAVIREKNIEVFEFCPDGEMDELYGNWLGQYEAMGQEDGLRQLKYHGYGDLIWIEKGVIKGGTSVFPEVKHRADKTVSAYEFVFNLLEDRTKEYLK